MIIWPDQIDDENYDMIKAKAISFGIDKEFLDCGLEILTHSDYTYSKYKPRDNTVGEELYQI